MDVQGTNGGSFSGSGSNGGEGSGGRDEQLSIEGQAVAYLGAWDFVLLALLALVLLVVIPGRVWRAVQRAERRRGPGRGKQE